METSPLINACKKNAESLLLEFSEFYPFALGLTATEEIVSVNAQMPDDDEFPTSENVISELQKALELSNRGNHFTEVCICLDVKVNIPKSQNATDALEIRLNFRDYNPLNYYSPYTVNNNIVSFGPDFYEDGEEFLTF
ncbi:MAG TPA: hypothetical protein VN040_19775 [Pseudosphingobacterium sp.]|nr:hypothetical protein [Pseudosphingobacterium sp.]